MNPVATILSLPVSGPLGMLGWIARQVANAATQQLLDPTRIETALLQLEKRLEAGQIDEATFEAEEERLLGELAEITAIRAAQEKAGTEESEDAGEGNAAGDAEDGAGHAQREAWETQPLERITGTESSTVTLEQPDPRQTAHVKQAESAKSTLPEPVPQEADAWAHL